MLMEVHFSPDVETRLLQAASASGKEVEQLVRETVNRMLDKRTSFIEGVERGIDQANRGELIDHEAIKARIDGLFKS